MTDPEPKSNTDRFCIDPSDFKITPPPKQPEPQPPRTKEETEAVIFDYLNARRPESDSH